MLPMKLLICFNLIGILFFLQAPSPFLLFNIKHFQSTLSWQNLKINTLLVYESCKGAMAVPLFSKRSLMPCAPDLAADTSSTPESMSSTRDRAVSKLLFMVVAITPVGPVFTQPLQYRPGETLKASKLNVVSLIPTAFFLNADTKMLFSVAFS